MKVRRLWGKGGAQVKFSVPYGSSVGENCVLKLSQINEKFRRRLPAKPLIHDRTVARNLEGMMFRVELARPVPAGRNRRDVLQRRKECENWFMNHAIMRHYVFIDRCGYNIWTARNYGRARQGERAYRQVCGHRGRNVNMALAVSPVNGLVFRSAYIARRFNDFLAQTRQNLDLDKEVIFNYDRAPAH